MVEHSFAWRPRQALPPLFQTREFRRAHLGTLPLRFIKSSRLTGLAGRTEGVVAALHAPQLGQGRKSRDVETLLQSLQDQVIQLLVICIMSSTVHR